MSETRESCFHCGLPVPERVIESPVDGEMRKFCCSGCASAAELIHSLGLEAYYRFRTETADPVVAAPGMFAQFGGTGARSAFVKSGAAGDTVYLDIQGINCSACAWLIERALRTLTGVREVSVNSATGRARILFDPQGTSLPTLLSTVASLGYRPAPLAGTGVCDDHEHEKRGHLTRLALSGFGMMQVMMFAVALYTGESLGMDAVMQSYMRYVSLVVATPVMMYAGWPFFSAAYAAIKSRHLTMDVPVTLGLVLAYGASVLNTVMRRGEVYFDSVTMFIFFLTLARFIEYIARRRSVSVTDSLSRLLPTLAHRIVHEGQGTEDVPVNLLVKGDEILIRSGEIVPADAVINRGSSSLDESMLTGEAAPLLRRAGDRVLAGSLNVGAPLYCRISSVGDSTVLSSIVTLLLRAQAERPRAVRAADLMARRFLFRVLLGAAVVFAAWHYIDPSRAFNATLAVLVVACPCALSLGPLIALASATSALARQGLLASHPDAIENLAGISRVVFDKTGTLTTGRLRLTSVRVSPGRDENRCLQIAAALEAGSEHPLARAFHPFAGLINSEQLKVTPSAGVAGRIDGKHYRLGAGSFAEEADPKHSTGLDPKDEGGIVLVEEKQRIATFQLADALRAEANEAVQRLRELGLNCEILSGDAEKCVAEIARSCGITEYSARYQPQQKLERVQLLLARGERVAMIGDGINDAPVLGAATVSIAMGQGSALAQASADVLLVRDWLAALPVAVVHARKTKRVMRQNMAWASAYNLLAIPLAALGWVPPWVAAIGMSASSIFVVLNSLRLGRIRGLAISPGAEPSLVTSRVPG
jgi:Cu2+-exporting ATPase